MFGTFVLGAIAGFAAPHAEAHIKKILENGLMAETSLEGAEMRALSLAVCLLIAALLSWLLASGGAVALALGGLCGVFGPRALARFANR